MEIDIVQFFADMAKSPYVILQQRGVFDPNGDRRRAAKRADILAVLEQNEGTASGIKFDGLDLSGADFRGLSLSGASFVGCNLTNVIASPMVIMNGQELGFEDDRSIRAIERCEMGEGETLQCEGIEVSWTRLEKATLFGANLNYAKLNFAKMQGSYLREIRADGTSFYKADLKNADICFGRLVQVDLREADLGNADLYGAQIETTLLESALWGDKRVVRQERKAEDDNLGQQERVRYWEEAVQVYRELARAHEWAGVGFVAGEFRYLRERAQSKLIRRRGLRLPASRKPNRWKGRVVWLWRRWALEWLHGYGERPWRVLRAVGLVMVIVTPWYFECTSIEISRAGAVEFLTRAVHAFYFSAVSTTALGYGPWFKYEAIGLQQYLGVAQSFVGVFLNALFVVTFVRRWMR